MVPRRVSALLLLLLCPASAMAASISLGASSFSNGPPPQVLGDRAYFIARSPLGEGDVWTTDGTPAGTWRITSLGRQRTARYLTVVGQRLYFFVSEQGALSLWSTDGTASGAGKIVEIPEHFATVHKGMELLYFTTAKDFSGNAERSLWRSDGTAAGTFVIGTIPYKASLRPVTAGRLFFFTISVPLYPYGTRTDLWRSDGTGPGTFVVGANLDTDDHSPATLGEIVYFFKDHQLWRSDGTTQGTSAIAPGYSWDPIVAVDGFVYFWGNTTLMKTDGTVAGTSVVKQAVPQPRHAVAANGRAFFFYPDNRKTTIGVTDGTAEGTRMLKPILGTYGYNDIPVAGRLVYFRLTTIAGTELWRTDGTDEGTFLVKDLSPGLDSYGQPASSLPMNFALLEDKLVFFADDGKHGVEPWVTDGTEAGTRMLQNIYQETTVRGVVKDALTGEPLPGAVVTASLYGLTSDFPVDADGHYTIEGLPDGDYKFSARGSDETHLAKIWPDVECRFCDFTRGSSIPARPGATFSGIDFTLARGGAVSGRVVTGSGTPVAGVEVLVASSFGATPVARAITNADGTYSTLGPIPATDSWLVYTSDRAGYSGVIYPDISCSSGCSAASQGTRVALQHGETRAGTDFVVRPWGRIRGQILDKMTGRRIVSNNVAVSAFAKACCGGRGPLVASTTLFSAGQFELALPDGRFNVLAEPDAYRTTWYPDRACDSSACFNAPAPTVSGVAGQTSGGYDFTVDPTGGRMTGRVTDAATGSAIAGTSLLVIDSTGFTRASAVTTATGSYETNPTLLPGASYTVRAMSRPPFIGETYDGAQGIPCDGCPLSLGKTLSLQTARQIVTGVDFTLNHFGRISGLAVDAVTHLPLKGVHVTMKSAADDSFVPLPATNASGRFGADDLPPGSYTLYAEKKGWSTTASVSATIALDSSAETSFTLTPSCVPGGAAAPATFPAEGGDGTIAIADGCTRCAFSTADFVKLPAACPAGPLKYTVTSNPTTSTRTAKIVLPGETIVVTQYGRAVRRRSVR